MKPDQRVTEPSTRLVNCVDQARLWRRLMKMAEIGAIPDNGVNRQALTREDIDARRQLVDWAKARGFGIAVDGIGNLFVRRPGRQTNAAPVVTGSHLDSQPQGGRFDGAYGVLAAFEVLEAFEDAGIATERPLVAVAWTNEEGGRFAPGSMGSMVFTGSRLLDDFLDAVDEDGVNLGDALADTLAAIPEADRWPFNFPISAYVEAHIEQGPRLESAAVPIGVVSGIQGSRWFEVEVSGDSAHAGATPLSARRDALQDAIAAIGRLNELLHDDSDQVRFTVGRMTLEPNTPNSVAGRVIFTIDLRHPDSATLARLSEAVGRTCQQAAARCDVSVRETFNLEPCLFDAKIQDVIESSARRLDVPNLRMPSGAFHDAQFLSGVCPTGMIFVPCENGISHNPKEFARPEDLAIGARVLAATVQDLSSNL